MTTLQGIIANSVNNTNVQSEVLGGITTNIANYSTVGYKRQRFEDYLQPDGSVSSVKRYDYSQGGLRKTDSPLDVAVDGAGFIQVTSKTGQTAYTRDGSFGVNSEGYLVTTDGYLVGDGIKVPANYDQVKISSDGTVKAILNRADSNQAAVLGKIPLVTFKNPEGLQSIENNKLLPTTNSGEPTLRLSHSSIKQGFLESSNTDIIDDVNNVLRSNASAIGSIKLIKVADDLYSKAISLRQ